MCVCARARVCVYPHLFPTRLLVPQILKYRDTGCFPSLSPTASTIVCWIGQTEFSGPCSCVYCLPRCLLPSLAGLHQPTFHGPPAVCVQRETHREDSFYPLRTLGPGDTSQPSCIHISIMNSFSRGLAPDTSMLVLQDHCEVLMKSMYCGTKRSCRFKSWVLLVALVKLTNFRASVSQWEE